MWDSVHELAHLHWGGLDTPNGRRWPDRRDLPHDVREFEADSISCRVWNPDLPRIRGERHARETRILSLILSLTL